MNSKHRKTRDALFEHPVHSDIRWADIESLFKALGAEIEERKGSRVAVIWEGAAPEIFHRPHPEPFTDKGAVRAARRSVERHEEET